MTSLSTERAIPGAGSGGPATAVQWAPEEFVRLPDGRVRVPDPREQDELIEAIAEAHAAREAELKAEVERRVEEAYRRGFDDGRRAGEEAEVARLRSTVRAAEEALDTIRGAESRWREGLEENICALAIAVARQILDREIRGSPGVVLELVRRAIVEFPIDQPVRIRVSPSDHAMVTGGDGADEAAAAVQGRETRWIADPHLSPGGCVVEGRDRIIDGRVDSALERLYRRLTHTTA